MSGSASRKAGSGTAVAPKRRFSSGRRIVRGPVQAPYEAASGHELVPNVLDPAPSVLEKQQRFLQMLARHLYRNDPFIRNLVNAAGRLYVGCGPTPVSRFPELDDLFCASRDEFDNSGRRPWGSWLRQEVFRPFKLDGAAFVRRRVRVDRPEARRLLVPIQFQAITDEYCPLDHCESRQVSKTRTLGYVNGIATERERPVSYAMWSAHPNETVLGVDRRMLYVDANEIYHLHDPLPGGRRGEVALASALLRAIKLHTLEDAEMRRKHVASLIGAFIERPVDASEEVELPSVEEVEDQIDSIALAPGGVYQLPYGYKMNAFTPPDEAANFERALRWQLMAICASFGMPVNEITGDDNGVERYGRFLTERVKSQAHLEHELVEHQVVDPMRRDWIDVQIATGQWTTPDDAKPWETYRTDWQWPVIPSARLDQEIGALLPLVDRGALPLSYVTRTLFGMEPESAARAAAEDAARYSTLGFSWTQSVWSPATPVAQRIAVAVDAEETAERDLVDGSATEDSVLDDDLN